MSPIDVNAGHVTPEMRRLEQDIEAARQRVASSLGEIKGQIAHAVDWHVWFERYPVVAICGAFAAGYVVAKVLF